MVISMTTTPAMCAHFLKARSPEETHSRAYRISEKFFSGMLRGYRHSLLWALDNSGLMLIVLALTIALNVVVIVKIPKGFFPQQDTGALTGGGQGPQDASFTFTNYSLLEIVKVIKADPAVAYVNAYTGGGRGATNGGLRLLAPQALSRQQVDASSRVCRA